MISGYMHIGLQCQSIVLGFIRFNIFAIFNIVHRDVVAISIYNILVIVVYGLLLYLYKHNCLTQCHQ